MFTTIDSVRVGFDIEDERHFTTLFTSAIQALIFATLAAYYIGEAVEEHH